MKRKIDIPRALIFAASMIGAALVVVGIGVGWAVGQAKRLMAR